MQLRQSKRIGADTKVSAMTKRGQAGVAEQQVEAERKHHPDQYFHTQVLVQADAVDPQGRLTSNAKVISIGRVIQALTPVLVVISLILQHAFLAEQAARTEADNQDQQQVHRHQRPFRGVGAGYSDGQADQHPGYHRAAETADATEYDN